MSKPIPRKLYKYCAFNVNTLHLLKEATIYFADPMKFNDPLDCSPSIVTDTSLPVLEKLFLKMFVAKAEATEDSRSLALQALRDERYQSTQYGNYESDPDAETYYRSSLGQCILALIREEFASHGVFCLAEKKDCPLMWSHYGAEHQGICIEYDLSDGACDNIQRVSYNSQRSIRCSDLVQWKSHGSEAARKAVWDAYFFTKAPQWKYERMESDSLNPWR